MVGSAANDRLDTPPSAPRDDALAPVLAGPAAGIDRANPFRCASADLVVTLRPVVMFCSLEDFCCTFGPRRRFANRYAQIPSLTRGLNITCCAV